MKHPFYDREFDCTILVRKTLPLPQVTLDTGPLNGKCGLRDVYGQSLHLVAESMHFATRPPLFAWECYQLSRWALYGTAPSLVRWS